jgi:hypothetical protein
MTQRISKPEAYIIGRALLPDGRHLSLDVMRTALDAVEDKSAIELLDLESANPAGDLASFVVKISEALPPTVFSQMAEVTWAASGNGVEYKLVRAVSEPVQVLSLDDVSTEYFRREFAVDSPFVIHSETCVKLTHRPTGLTARCTDGRQKSRNFEEALLVLASLVASFNMA